MTLTVDDQQVPIPTASFANRVLTLSCEDQEAQIRYTLDGTTPTAESTLYTAPIALTQDCTVLFFAQRENFNDSEVASFEFTMTEYQVAIPGFGYDAETATLTISCATENAEIRYTVDGSDPTASTGIVYEGPIHVEGNSTFKARAFRSDLLDSNVVSLTINDQTVPTPTASFANKTLTLSCEDQEAQIRYTLDGTTPTAESTLYTAPIALTQDCTVLFFAQRENFNDSEVGAFQFILADYRVDTPVFVYDNEGGNVTISCDTENAEIRYTVDGSVPTAENGTIYEGPIALEHNLTINAKAFRSDLYESELASLVVDDQTVPTPTASFANKQLTLMCPDTQATILYTTDGTDPTSTSAVYSSPLALTQSCTVKFYALRDGFNDSPIGSFQFVIESYRVATPVLSYNPIDASLTISCATENAQIRYTSDGSEPTASTGTVYGGPISFYGNISINARAFRNDLFDSEVASLVISGQKVPTPTASFADKQLTLACSDSRAQIRYTLDGSTPTAASTLYEAPISLTAECTVRFIAIRDNFNDSDVASFEFRVADYQVAAPVITHSLETMTATMTCETEGATIRYTTDGSEPTATTGTLYEQPVAYSGNVTFTARAFHDSLFDSELTVYTISDLKLPTPVAKYAAHALTIECGDSTASVRYTVDGSDPTEDSAEYSTPIQLASDCTVRFIAFKPGYVASDEGNFKFVLADYRETTPAISPDYAGRTLTISHPESLQVRLTVRTDEGNDRVETMKTPATIEVDPTMTSVSAYTLAQNDDRYDSEATDHEITFHAAPVIDYDGHTLSLRTSENEPAKANASIHLYVDGTSAGTGSAAGWKTEIADFCNVEAYVESDDAYISDKAERRIDVFNTGRVAGARNGHRLAEAFGTWGDSADSYSYLRLKGEINNADLKSVAALPKLTSLHIEAEMADDDYSEVLSGTGIETLYSNSYPEGMLSGMPRLTTLIWGNTNEPLPARVVSEAGNPNLLVWVSDEASAETGISNIVRYPASANESVADPTSHKVAGTAERILLQYGYPFNVHQSVGVDYIELTKDFTMPTFIDEPAGWESLVLPFDAESVRHERAGDIVSFAAWEEPQDQNGPKAYWLYRASDSQWEAAKEIEAGVPYIISMPNNEEYVESFNLPGTVTFSAENVMINPESLDVEPTDWMDGTQLEATFMPVDGASFHALNVNGEGGGYSGSRFEPGARIYPFGAYIRGGDARRAMPIFGNGNGVGELPTLTASGIVVETPASGTVRISSGKTCQTAIVTPEGAVVRTLSLRAGESVTVEGLTRGIYIVAGIKVMVK